MLSMLGEEEVTAGTDVFYICQQYSLVFVLDMTSTTMQVVSEPFNITVLSFALLWRFEIYHLRN